MNRLILIGNGFDLAHKLKTAYKDFITDYLWNIIRIFHEEGYYEDKLINISYLYKKVLNREFKLEKSFIPVRTALRALDYNGGSNTTKVNFESNLLITLIKECEYNWVDIETIYFNHLKSVSNNIDWILKLNSQFEYLKNKLEEYLTKIDQDNIQILPGFSDLLKQPIYGHEIVNVARVQTHTPIRIHILNFNYTSTIERYVAEMAGTIPTTVNYIHGTLNNPNNPIIFGFGDEYDKDYIEFENHYNNTLFHNIKSFGYFKTKNYHDLIKFLDKDNFQVFIIGHSCGLSDRTMLKHIFEHKKCVSIKIFHHDGLPGFTEKTYDIARHFTNKGEMRLKIAPYNINDSIPQIP